MQLGAEMDEMYKTRAVRSGEAQTAQPIANWLGVVSHLDPKYGGLSTVVPQLATRLIESGRFHVQLEVFCLPEERCKPSGHPEMAVSFWPMSRSRWLLDRSLSRVFHRAVAQSDGVHIHGLWEQSTFVAARTARELRKPYILSAHGMLEPWALASKRLKKRIYAALFERANVQGAFCLHALTAGEARSYRAWGCTRPIAIIPNGVEVPAEVRTPGFQEAFLGAFPRARGRRLVLFLGRLHRKKGVDLLMEAWAALARRWPETLLVMAGPSEGNTRPSLEAAAEKLGIADRVLFTGMLGPQLKWSALAAADCFVLPSYSEGLSVATLEAMGSGLPVIVTEHCHLPEVAAQDAGWEIQPDVAELEAALGECLASTPERNQERGRHGAALVRQRYSWSVVTAQMAELYTWVQGGPAPRSFTVESEGPL